jgi:3-oxoadipate enol-lactonase
MSKLRLEDAQIHYEILGEGASVVFLNGILMTTQSWVLQTSLLRQRFRCVLYDMAGQLLSPRPTTARSMEGHAEDLVALLDHLEIERCHLVGTSFGGEVGLICAARHPSRVESLAVIASVGYPEPLLRSHVESWARLATSSRRDLYRYAAPSIFSNRFLQMHPDAVAQAEERFVQLPERFFHDFVELVAAFLHLDLRELLAGIGCPTLVICGEEDALKPVRYSRAIADAIPHAELLSVPEAGHAVVIERPEEVNSALLGFLEKQRDADMPEKLDGAASSRPE